MSTLRFGTYDAGIVSQETVRVLLYGMTTSAPWLVREASPPAPRPPRLLDRVSEAIRSRHYSRRTEKAYVHWIRRFIFFHGKRHPAEMGAAEVAAFLTSLAVQDKVAASTQKIRLSAPSSFCIARCLAWTCRGSRMSCAPSARNTCRWGPDPRRDPRPPPETERRATDRQDPARAAHGPSAGTTRGRPPSRSRLGRAIRSPPAEVPACQTRMGVAVGLPRHTILVWTVSPASVAATISTNPFSSAP